MPMGTDFTAVHEIELNSNSNSRKRVVILILCEQNNPGFGQLSVVLLSIVYLLVIWTQLKRLLTSETAQ